MKRHQNAVALLISLSLLIAVSLGCRSFTERIKEAVEKAESIEPTELDSDNPANSEPVDYSDGDLVKKNNLYITNCINKYSNSVLNSYSRYTSWLKDPKAGPTGNERLVYGLYRLSGDGSDCEKAIKEAAEISPSLPEVHASAEKYATALKEAAKQISSVYDYYDRDDYKDDNFQKGKSSHGPLMAAFEAFQTANREFADHVDQLEDEVAKQKLEEYRDDPSMRSRFTAADFSIKAKKAMIYVSRTKYAELSTETLQTHIDEIEAASAELKAAAGNAPGYSMFLISSDSFVKASKDLMRRIRDKKPFSSFEQRQIGTPSGWLVEGSPDKVIYEYNNLIRARGFLRR
jgi:hypothetical protein